MVWFTEWTEARRQRLAAERAASNPYLILEPEKPAARSDTEVKYRLGPPPPPRVQTVKPKATDGSGEPVL